MCSYLCQTMYYGRAINFIDCLTRDKMRFITVYFTTKLPFKSVWGNKVIGVPEKGLTLMGIHSLIYHSIRNAFLIAWKTLKIFFLNVGQDISIVYKDVAPRRTATQRTVPYWNQAYIIFSYYRLGLYLGEVVAVYLAAKNVAIKVVGMCNHINEGANPGRKPAASSHRRASISQTPRFNLSYSPPPGFFRPIRDLCPPFPANRDRRSTRPGRPTQADMMTGMLALTKPVLFCYPAVTSRRYLFCCKCHIWGITPDHRPTSPNPGRNYFSYITLMWRIWGEINEVRFYIILGV